MRRLAPAGRAAEEGFAIVAAVIVLAIVIMFGLVTVQAATSSLNLASRGKQDAQALQAAEAAAQIGWNRINLVHIDSLGLSLTTPCLSWSLSGDVTAVSALVLGGSSWCPAVTVAVPGASQASYQLSELTLGSRYIVGSATVGGVTRRIELTLNQSTTASSPFNSFALESQAALTLAGTTQVSGAGVRSGGAISLQGNTNAGSFCHVSGGPITPGQGDLVSTSGNASTCGNSTTAATSALSLSALTMPTSNDDSRICVSSEDKCTGSPSWNPVTLTLSLSKSSSTVTLTGNTYVFCGLSVTGGTLKFAPANGKAVEVYFEPPTLCTAAQLLTGAPDLILGGSYASIVNSTGQNAAGVQFLMDGQNSFSIGQLASTVNAVFYAPSGTVALSTGASVKGAVAAATATMSGTATLTYDSSAATVTPTAGSLFYSGKQYVECPATAGSGQAPDAGCPS